MRITKYQLRVRNDRIELLFYSPDTQKGYCVIESCPYVTGKSLPGLRKNGASKAKRFNVPFEDLTVR